MNIKKTKIKISYLVSLLDKACTDSEYPSAFDVEACIVLLINLGLIDPEQIDFEVTRENCCEMV